ncbi:hypothetical protein VYU27_005525 [Nannochloropsis oceanica]
MTNPTGATPAKKPCLEHQPSNNTKAVIASDIPLAAAGPVIGTHDGTFHCDEVLAISMLRLLPAYKESVVVRTRDPTKLAQCQIVVDVGAEYDASGLRFDHHQRGFEHTLGDKFKTKLSSAGLVYKHFGRDMLRVMVVSSGAAATFNTEEGVKEEDLMLDKLYIKTYLDFVEHIDGIDNGINIAEGNLRYTVQTHLPGRVATLNPAWNEDDSANALNERFADALAMVSTEFINFVGYLCKSWWPARQRVAEGFQGRFTVHPSGKILHLMTYCPWQDHLFDLELDAGVPGQVLYVLYADSKGSSVRIHAVPDRVGSFALRLAMPEAWRGLRNEVLGAAVGGIPGCIFVHANGFIGGNATLEGAMEMAKLALTYVV